MSNKGEFLVRNVPSSHVEELNRIAKELSEKREKKISRNDVCLLAIAYFCEQGFEKYEYKFEQALNNVDSNLLSLTDKLQVFIDQNAELMAAVFGSRD